MKTVIKNLICHVWPKKGSDTWRWNVAQLLRRISQFNGQRIVSVVTDDSTVSVDEVKEAFQGTIKDFLHFPNNEKTAELVSFRELMSRVENIDPRQNTFYCHFKGVRYSPNHPYAPQVRKWTAAMYESLLDYPEVIVDQLKRHIITGSFLKASPGFSEIGCEYHYSGTFFWLNNLKIFSQASWDRVHRAYWGVEGWPGLVCPLGKAGRVFSIDRPMGWHLYHKKFWEDSVDRPWYDWQVAHARLHRTQNYKEVLTTLRLEGKQRIVVSGPQRSGTTIAAKILAHDLGFKYIDEAAYNGHDFNKMQELLRKPRVVIHAPAMSRHLLLIPDAAIVWMYRDLKAILQSQKIAALDIYTDMKKPYDVNERAERIAYGDNGCEPLASVKLRYWEEFQRISLGDRAFDLDYESLRGHPLWIDKEGRQGFHVRQTKNPYYC